MIRTVLLLLVTVSLLQAQQPADPHSAARTALNQGVAAYKQARYEEAISAFRKAASLDPELVVARLYLATALAQQYIPGVDTADNTAYAEQAIAEFTRLVDANPPREQQLHALKGIASLYFNMKKLEDARDVYRRLTDLDPNDPETYYTIGVIDWTETYQPRMEARSRLGLKPTEPLNSYPECLTVRDLNADKVGEGIDMLNKALQLRPDYDDAMAYMNLMYRERADIACGDMQKRSEDLSIADLWVDKTMAVKKAKAERAQTPQP